MQISDFACEGCTLVFEGKSREMQHLCNGYTNKKKRFDVQALCDFNCDDLVVYHARKELLHRFCPVSSVKKNKITKTRCFGAVVPYA
jgi:hypothetical protein